MPEIRNGQALSATLSDIEQALSDRVPIAAREAQIQERAYALILCYIDSTTDQYAPYAILALESARDSALKEDLSSAATTIWAPHQQLELPNRLPEITVCDALLTRECNACYEFLMEQHADMPDEEMLRPFREMMYRVARCLNELTWGDFINPTDDFVVIASDWTGLWVQEDAAASLLPAQRELLRSRHLFFNGPAELSQAERQKRIKRLLADVSARSVGDQVDYWIGQLTHMIDEMPCDVTRIGCDLNLVEYGLQDVGAPAVVPLLNFVREHLDAQLGQRDAFRARVLFIVQDIGRGDVVAHQILRELLDESCRINAGQPKWQTMPFHCAKTLHVLYCGYPNPRMGSKNVLQEHESFLALPMPNEDK